MQHTMNSLYHTLKAAGRTRDEAPRARVVVGRSPKLGAMVTVLLDYTVPGKLARRYAYGAVVLFRDLGEHEYDRLVEASIQRFGRTDAGEQHAALALMARPDAVAIQQDADVLAHPLMRQAFGEVHLPEYVGGSLGLIEEGAIARQITEIHREVHMADHMADLQEEPESDGPAP